MKNFFLIFLIPFCFFHSVNAQSTFTTDTSFNTQMNHIFAPLDKTKVPFGILRDYGMEFTNLSAYSGTVQVDSTKSNYSTVMDVYNTLASGVISTNAGTLVHPLAFDSIWQSQRQPGVITLAGLFFQYASFVSNAVTNNLITITNSQIYDKYVGGVWQNPYQNQQVFAVSPSTNAYNTYSSYQVQAILPANAWISNSSTLVSSLTADFADGMGFRNLVTGQTFSLSYSSGGIKTWTFKLTLTNGSILQSRTDIQLDSSSVLVYNFKKQSGGLAKINPVKKIPLKSWGYPINPVPIPITADVAYYGQKASGFMTISYANSDLKFHQPLIIAEGFDPGDITKPEQLTGEMTMVDFLNDVKASSSAGLKSLLNNGSYDIIYVDWKHGTDFIERNAMLLEKVIAYVNANRATTTPNVVLGISMGSLVARYALKDMENKSINHQTKMYMSWDGPHQGANVPLAYQYLSRQARSLYIQTSLPQVFSLYSTIIHPAPNNFVTTIKNLRTLYVGSPYSSFTQNIYVGDQISGELNLQDFPSSREMLINYLSLNYITHSLSIDNSLHNAWQSTLKTIGYPQGFTGQPCTNIAISNGSECAATEDFVAGQAMLDVRGNVTTSFLGDILASIGLPTAGFVLNQPSLLLSVLPGTNIFNVRLSCYAQPDGVSGQQYVGTVSYTKVILFLIPLTTYWTNWNVVSDASIFPYDYFPGGEYYTGVNLKNTSNTQLQGLLAKFSITVNAEFPSFDFIPVPSALDIGSGNTSLLKADYLTRYVGALPPVAPKNSPFSAFITAFSLSTNNNEPHTFISTRNGDWVYAQLINASYGANCSFLCTNSNIAVSGPNPLCSSGTYSLQNFGTLTPNSTVIWSASPAGIVSLTPNGTQVSATRLSNGTVTISATINNSPSDCGSSAIINSALINTGAPDYTKLSVVGETPYCPNVPIMFGARYNGSCTNFTADGITNVTWTVTPAPTQIVSNAGTAGCGAGTNSGVTIKFPSSPTLYSVKITATNSCGTSSFSSPLSVQLTGGAGCGMNPMFAVSPNPANSMVTVSSVSATQSLSQNDIATKSVSSGKIYQIKVVDQLGNVKKIFNYPGGVNSSNIDLSKLISGTYVLQIYDNVTWTSEQVVLIK